MPRIKAACGNEKLSKRCERLRRFVPCFFDVPHKHVLEIVGISHHTLDPIRRSLSLDGWPYNEVMRGKFCMSRARIVALRAQAMESADEEMQRVLYRIAVKAEECWGGLAEGLQKLALDCEDSKRGLELCEVVMPPRHVPEPSQAAQLTVTDDYPQAPSWEAPDEERAFWDEICDLLQLREALAPPEPPLEQ